MDSRNSWIDRRELSELLKQLMPDAQPPANLSRDQAEPETDDPISLLADNAPEWENPSTAPLHRSEAELRREALRSLHSILPFTSGSFSPGDAVLPQIHPETTPKVQPKASPPPPAGPEFQMPSGPLAVRLRAFTAWVGRVTGCRQIFITDVQGYSLLDSDASENATAVGSALQLLEALDKFRQRMQCADARSGLYLPLGPSEWFGVVECESSLGTVCLCLVIPAPLSAAAALELARVLRSTIEA